MKGIDISMHNGNIDFSKIESNGVLACYIKATEGVNYIDPKFRTYVNLIRNTGINYGMYHFMSERTSPSMQAIDFYNAIKDTSYNLIPVLDIESNSMGRNRTQISNRCLEFLNKFYELTKIRCIIYTGGYFGRDLLNSSVKTYNGWIAHYGVSTPLNTGFKVVGHQYTDSGKIPGINGYVDLNNFTTEILLGNRNVNVNNNNIINTNNNYFQECKKYNTPNIIEIQSKLLALNYTLGGYGVDGIYGIGTHNSIGNFQRNNGLYVDNKFGPLTRAKANLKLSSIICGIAYKTPGATSYIQRKLNIKVDGIFGTDTEKAVKEFQKNNNLKEDGIVGILTWNKLL